MTASMAILASVRHGRQCGRILRLLAAITASVLLVIAANPPAAARVRTHVFLGFDFFVPAYPYYHPPPAYYYPPPTYYYPPPAVYYYAPPIYTTPAQNCRRFNGDATIDASGAPFYGTACLQVDGRWHILN